MSLKDRFGGNAPSAAPLNSGVAMYDAVPQPKDASIGQLVSTAIEQISTLIRTEIELAKAEVGLQIKRGAVGSIFFILAIACVLISFFPFVMMWANLFALWLGTMSWLWCGYLITFAILIVVAVIFVVIGLMKVKQVEKPEKTIESIEALKTVVPSAGKPVPTEYTYLQ